MYLSQLFSRISVIEFLVSLFDRKTCGIWFNHTFWSESTNFTMTAFKSARSKRLKALDSCLLSPLLADFAF
jgi:hypothetical protein